MTPIKNSFLLVFSLFCVSIIYGMQEVALSSDVAAVEQAQTASASSSSSADEQERVCAICLERNQEDNPLKKTKCRHWFHAPCLDQWRQTKNSCPQCRRKPVLFEDEQEAPVIAQPAESTEEWYYRRSLERTARIQAIEQGVRNAFQQIEGTADRNLRFNNNISFSRDMYGRWKRNIVGLGQESNNIILEQGVIENDLLLGHLLDSIAQEQNQKELAQAFNNPNHLNQLILHSTPEQRVQILEDMELVTERFFNIINSDEFITANPTIQTPATAQPAAIINTDNFNHQQNFYTALLDWLMPTRRYNRLRAAEIAPQSVNIGGKNEYVDLNYSYLHGNLTMVSLNLAYRDLTSLEGLNNIEGAAKITHLRVDGNPLRKIPAGAFSSMPNLRNIDLAQSKLTEIDPDAFINNPHLESINLSINQLKTLPANLFRNQPHLKWINLNSNPLMPYVRRFFQQKIQQQTNEPVQVIYSIGVDTY